MRKILAAVLLSSLAQGAGAAGVRLSPPDRALTAGTTFSMSIGVEGSTRPVGGYLFQLAFDQNLLILQSLAPEGDHEFSEEFFKNGGIAGGGGSMGGLNSRSLSAPVGSAGLTVARFRVNPSTAIFSLNQVLDSAVSVTVREAVDAVDTAGSTIPVNGATLAFQVIGDTVAPVTGVVFSPQAASVDPQGRPIISTDALVGFAVADSGAYVSGVAETRYTVDGGTAAVPITVFTSPFILDAGTHTITWLSRDNAGNVEVAKSTEVLVRPFDATPPVLFFEPVRGSTVTTDTPEIVVFYHDAGVGLDLNSLSFMVDSVDVSTLVVVGASSVTYRATLSQGSHALIVQIADKLGNAVIETSNFTIDSVSPVTSLLVNGSTNVPPSILSTDSLGFLSTEPGETRYSIDGGGESVYASTFSLTPGSHALSFHSVDAAGNAEAERTVTLEVLAPDDQAPVLSLIPAAGSTVTTATPLLLVTADEAAVFTFELDGLAVSTSPVVWHSSAAVTVDVAQGTHTWTARAVDPRGNASEATAAFFVDSIAPLTTLLLNGLEAAGAGHVIVSTDSIGFSATEGETRYALNGGSQQVFTSTFSVEPGTHTLAFHSVDAAGNAEAARSVFLDSRAPRFDQEPPLLRLDFPGGLGVERAVGGVVDVRGRVSDPSGVTWTLEVTAGSGWTTLASGASGASGTLVLWDTSAYPGERALRLSAVDGAGNSGAETAQAFVGRPVAAYSIGSKDADAIVPSLKDPTGIAVRPDGLIWVSGTQSDRLLLLTATGTAAGQSLKLKNPQGLALDAAGNVYVADKGKKKVYKLSPDGSETLMTLGGLEQPFDVAVDANGDVYVADDGHNRVKVFSAAGAFLRDLGEGVLLATSGVRGVAVTAEGVWVTDKEQERLFLLSRTGVLLASLGDAESPAGELSRTRGLAADSLGAVYVVERNRDRLQKFDPRGRGLIAFGSRDLATPAERAAKSYLKQPFDAAVGPDGSLWVTDAGRDRIVRYAIPAAGYALASAGGQSASAGEDKEARLVDARDGGHVVRDDGSGVRVPEGALRADLEITVETAAGEDAQRKEAKRAERRVQAASEEIEYGPEGTTFSKPVTLTLAYTPAPGLDEDKLKAHYWNPTLGDWEPLASTVDKRNRTVSAQTSHFSLYQVLGSGSIGAASALGEFGLREVYAYPNPARGRNPSFHIDAGAADSITLKIYDVTGRALHEAHPAPGSDYVWDVGGVGSGVYYYSVTAKKAGHGDQRKTGKVAVIK